MLDIFADFQKDNSNQKKGLGDFMNADTKMLALAFFYIQELIDHKENYEHLEESARFINDVSDEQMIGPSKPAQFLDPEEIVPAVEKIIEMLEIEDFLGAGAKDEYEAEQMLDALKGFKKFAQHYAQQGEKFKLLWS